MMDPGMISVFAALYPEFAFSYQEGDDMVDPVLEVSWNGRKWGCLQYSAYGGSEPYTPVVYYPDNTFGFLRERSRAVRAMSDLIAAIRKEAE